MYEKLVKSLRLCSTADPREYFSGCAKCIYEDGGCEGVLLESAADAIEELSKPRWIPVTEALPKEEKEVYWCYTNMGIMCECRWTNNKYGLGESDKWGWNIIDVPQYQRVTHWMPLPEPPKEET